MALAALVSACPAPDGGAPRTGQATVRVTVDTTGGPMSFAVEEADTEQRRRNGLMRRDSLPERGGMLFEYPDARERTFWMRDTCLPLDIVFVGPDGRVIRVARDAEPLSDAPIPSYGPASLVLEVAAGGASGVGPGDEVTLGPR